MAEELHNSRLFSIPFQIGLVNEALQAENSKLHSISSSKTLQFRAAPPRVGSVAYWVSLFRFVGDFFKGSGLSSLCLPPLPSSFLLSKPS